MKIATWNINGINSRLGQVIDWCVENEPDVLCLQETKCVDAKFPHQRLRSIGFDHIECIGEKAYNGVAIISKYPLADVQKNFPHDPADAPKRLLAVTINGIRIVNTTSPTEPDSALTNSRSNSIGSPVSGAILTIISVRMKMSFCAAI